MEYDESPVHERYQIKTNSKVHYLKHAIWQLPFNDLAESIHKMNRYSSLGASKSRQKGSSFSKALGHSIWAFIRHYVFKRGFLDGWAGFVIAFAYSEVTFYRYAKAVELAHQEALEARWQEIQKTNPR